jgi:hypothetical protein
MRHKPSQRTLDVQMEVFIEVQTLFYRTFLTLRQLPRKLLGTYATSLRNIFTISDSKKATFPT